MTSFEYTLSIVCSLGVTQSLFVAYVLYFRKEGNIFANKLLSALIVFVSLRIIKPLLLVFADLPFFIENLGIAAMLLAMPFFFMYLRSLLENRNSFLKYDWLHFIPVSVYFLVSWNVGSFVYELYSLIMVHNLIYFGVCIYLVFSHQQAQEEKLYQWVLWLTSGIGIIWTAYVYTWLFHPTIPTMIKTSTTGYTLLIGALMYLMFRKKLIFADSPPPKYMRSKISSEASKKLFQELEKIIVGEKLFLDPDLKLSFLAKKMEISEREISQIVNQNTNTNFSDWLNNFRINEAKKRLVNPQEYAPKIAAIAFECGFNTLSSFNTVFKAKTGFTPSEYRNFHKITDN
jgi:AraC-like DNA-binding protein